MGRHLASEGPLPDAVVCSTAVRARETWERVGAKLAAAGAVPEVVFERGVYLAGAGALLERVQGCGEAPCVLLIGHLPGVDDLARALARGGDEEAWHRLRDKFPTGGLATLVFDTERWSEVRPSAGELRDFVVPRDLA